MSEVAFEVGRLYPLIKTIADVMSASRQDIFIQLPGLMAYYPMSLTAAGGTAINHSGAGGPLTQVGTVPIGYDGNAYRRLGVGTDYLSGTGLYGLTGTETFIDSSIRGFTIGGWFQVVSVPATNAGLMSKESLSPGRGYSLKVRSGGDFAFQISSDGTATIQAISSSFSIGQWRFIVGRFMPSVEVAVFVDVEKTVITASVYAAVNASAQAFEVGRFIADNTKIVDGLCRDVFVCASALTDEQIEALRLATMP